MLKSFFNKNTFYFLGFFVLVWVIIINLFPKGYVFSGGDTAQLIEAKDNFKSVIYDWEGRAALFNLPFFFLDKIGLSDSIQLSFYLGIFIFGSYISFDIFIRLLFNDIKPPLRMALSLFYSLNVYTLYVFSGNWGYSYFQSLYIFLPILIAYYIKLLKTNDRKYLIFFVLFLFISASGFANPAFAISFAAFLFVIFALLVISGSVRPEKSLFYNLVLLCVLSFLVSLYWIWPLLPQASEGVGSLFSGNAVDLNTWLAQTSNPIQNTLSMHHYSESYFPDNFPYASIYFLKNFFILLTFIPALLILWGLIKIRTINQKERRFFLVFFGTLLIWIILVARVREPFESINHFLYNLWGINTLRGYDKTAIFVPFIMASLLTIVFGQLMNKNNKKLFFLIMAFILLTPLPFYFGKLQQNMSYRFSNVKPENKNYRKSRISFLVKIPDDYYRIRDKINQDGEKNFIASFPYSSNDGSGIANYPEWKLYAVDITRYLYNKKFIEANSASFNGWNFIKSFNEDTSGQYEWIVKLLGLMNVKYIIYHKDTTEDSLKQTEFKMEYLENKGLIEKIDSNKYFNLYTINKNLIVPYISWQKSNINLEENEVSINREFDKIINNIELANYYSINPKKYKVFVNGAKKDYVTLAEPFSLNWKAYAIDRKGQETEIKDHIKARGYANGWKIENNDNIKEIVIEYYPTRLMWRGTYISLATILFLIGYLLRYYYVEKNKKIC